MLRCVALVPAEEGSARFRHGLTGVLPTLGPPFREKVEPAALQPAGRVGATCAPLPQPQTCNYLSSAGGRQCERVWRADHRSRSPRDCLGCCCLSTRVPGRLDAASFPGSGKTRARARPPYLPLLSAFFADIAADQVGDDYALSGELLLRRRRARAPECEFFQLMERGHWNALPAQ